MKNYWLDYFSDMSTFWSYKREDVLDLNFIAVLIASLLSTIIATSAVMIGFFPYLIFTCCQKPNF